MSNLKSTDELSKLLNEYAAKSQVAGTLSDDEKAQILAKQDEARHANVLSGLANAAGLIAGAASGQEFKGLGEPLEKSGALSLQEAKTLAAAPKSRAKTVMDQYKAKKDALIAEQRDESQQRNLEDKQTQFNQGEENKNNRMKTIISNRTIIDPYTGEVKTFKNYFGSPQGPGQQTPPTPEKKSDTPEAQPETPKKTLKVQQMENQQLTDMSKEYEKAGIPSLLPGVERTSLLLQKYGVDLGNDKTFNKSVPGLSPLERMLPQGVMSVTDKMGLTKPELSQDAIDLRQGMQQARDFMLKLQSGGAVPKPEELRFLEQVGAGKFDDSRPLISGYRSILERMKSEAKNIESKSQGVKDLYKERTGDVLASEKLNSVGKSKPIENQTPGMSDKVKIQMPNGNFMTIPKENLDAAKKRVPGLKVL